MAGRLLLSAPLLLAAAALAQPLAPDAGFVDLPPVVVQAPFDDAPPATSPLVRDASGAVTVVDAAARRGESKDVAALLSQVPGAQLTDTGGAGQKKSLSLRGTASNAVLVLLDGVPLAAPGGAADLSLVPAPLVDQLEVLRGAGASRYGPLALGGVVNVVTRKEPGTHLFAQVSQGSFLTTQLTAGGGAPLAGGEALALLHGLRSEGDFPFQFDEQPALDGQGVVTRTRLNNAALQGGGLLRFRRAFGPSQLELVAQGAATARGLAGTAANPTVDARQQALGGTLSARWVRPLEDGDVSVLGWARVQDGTLVGSPFGFGDYPQLESGAGAEVVWRQLFAARHGVTALLTGGGDWLAEPTGTNPSWGRAGAMLADEVRLFDDALTVDASARVDVAGPFTVFSPKLGATLALPAGLSVRANAGQLSRTPSFLERNVVQGTLLPNAELRPERALTADVGVSWDGPRASLTVTGFASLVEDLITYEYYPPALARPYNVLTARLTGVEVEGVARPWRWLTASVAYTFLDTANLRDDPRYYGQPLPLRPPHRLSARVEGGVQQLQGHLEVDAQSSQALNRTGKLWLPGRALVNLGVTGRPWRRTDVALSLEVRNLLDVSTQDLDGYPLPPRALYLTLSAAWEAAPSTRPHEQHATLR